MSADPRLQLDAKLCIQRPDTRMQLIGSYAQFT
jgi:hypothetical protein